MRSELICRKADWPALQKRLLVKPDHIHVRGNALYVEYADRGIYHDLNDAIVDKIDFSAIVQMEEDTTLIVSKDGQWEECPCNIEGIPVVPVPVPPDELKQAKITLKLHQEVLDGLV